MGEKTKFLDVRQLWRLQQDPSRGQQVQEALRQFVRTDQAAAVVDAMAAGTCGRRTAGRNCRRGPSTAVLTVPAGATVVPAAKEPNVLVLTSPADGPPVRFQQQSGKQVRLTAEGHTCRVRVTVPEAQTDPPTADVTVDMQKAVIDAADLTDTVADPNVPPEPDAPVPAPLDRQFHGPAACCWSPWPWPTGRPSST